MLLKGLEEGMQTNKEAIALEKLRHKNKMLEITTETEGKIAVEKLKFDNNMQLQRIKTAEIRKSMDRKANIEYMNSYKGK